MSRENRRTILALLVITAVLVFAPLFALKGAEFGGSDDAGSVMAEEIGGAYEPGLPLFWKPWWGESFPERLKACCFAFRQESAWESWHFYGTHGGAEKWEDRKEGKRKG